MTVIWFSELCHPLELFSDTITLAWKAGGGLRNWVRSWPHSSSSSCDSGERRVGLTEKCWDVPDVSETLKSPLPLPTSGKDVRGVSPSNSRMNQGAQGVTHQHSILRLQSTRGMPGFEALPGALVVPALAQLHPPPHLPWPWSQPWGPRPTEAASPQGLGLVESTSAVEVG